MTKAELRQQVLSVRKNLQADERHDLSKIVFDKVVALPEFEASRNLFVYIDFNNEVETKLLIKYALAIGKTVSVPLIKEDGHMIAVEIRSWLGLKKNFYGILEPADETNIVSRKLIDTAIMPGIAFDKKLNRVGFGKGYYDKFLTDTKIKKIALAYDFQIVEKIPADKLDIKADMIVTPTRIIK